MQARLFHTVFARNFVVGFLAFVGSLHGTSSGVGAFHARRVRPQTGQRLVGRTFHLFGTASFEVWKKFLLGMGSTVLSNASELVNSLIVPTHQLITPTKNVGDLAVFLEVQFYFFILDCFLLNRDL